MRAINAARKSGTKRGGVRTRTPIKSVAGLMLSDSANANLSNPTEKALSPKARQAGNELFVRVWIWLFAICLICKQVRVLSFSPCKRQAQRKKQGEKKGEKSDWPSIENTSATWWRVYDQYCTWCWKRQKYRTCEWGELYIDSLCVSMQTPVIWTSDRRFVHPVTPMTIGVCTPIPVPLLLSIQSQEGSNSEVPRWRAFSAVWAVNRSRVLTHCTLHH